MKAVFSILFVCLIVLSVPASNVVAQDEGDIIFKEPTPVPIPPMRYNDLNKCITQLPTPTEACDQVCASRDKCTLVCTYRLNAKGECYPYARCGECAEVPPDDLPLDPSGGGNTR